MKIIKIKCKKQNKYIHVILLQVSEENEESFWLSKFLKAIGICIHLYRCIIKIKVIRNQIKSFILERASKVSEEIFLSPTLRRKARGHSFRLPSFRPPSSSRCLVYATPATVLLQFLWDLNWCLGHRLKMCILFGYHAQIIFCHFFHKMYLVIFPAVVNRYYVPCVCNSSYSLLWFLWNFTCVSVMVWRCAYIRPWATKGFAPPRGNFVDYVFLKAWHLTSFLQHVGHLAVGAFGCCSVLNTLPLIFLKNKNIKLRPLKWYLYYSNWFNRHVICKNSKYPADTDVDVC